MAEKNTEKQNNKVLLIIIAILIVGLIYLGMQVSSLKNEVAKLSSEEKTTSSLSLPGIISPFKGLSKQRPWDSFDDDWDPFAEIDRIQKEMNRMFRDSFGRGQSKFGLFSKHRPFDLNTDVRDTKSHYIVQMDIPGMDKADISVEVKNNVLVVSGERRELKEEDNKKNFFRRERNFGYFTRTVPLPKDADHNTVSAEYKKGVLTVKIGKKKDAEKTEEDIIKINVS